MTNQVHNQELRFYLRDLCSQGAQPVSIDDLDLLETKYFCNRIYTRGPIDPHVEMAMPMWMMPQNEGVTDTEHLYKLISSGEKKAQWLIEKIKEFNDKN